MNPIAQMLLAMARFYGYELEERQLEMYVEVLAKFPEATVLQSGKEYIQNPKNEKFPIPPHKILAKYLPQEADSKDVGREVALRIRHAVSKFGWPSPADARAHIGDLGWGVVERLGGWQHICENLGVTIQETTFMAQCRDAVESTHRLGEQGFDPARPSIEQSTQRKGDLIQVDAMKLIPTQPEIPK